MPEPTNQQVLDTMGKMFSGLTDKVLKDIIAKQQSIIEKTEEMDNKLYAKVETVKNSIKEVKNQVTESYDANMSAMSKAFTKQYQAIETSSKERYEKTKEYVNEKYNAVSNSISSALTTISDQWESTKKSIIDAKNVLQEKIANVGAMVSTAMTRFKSSMDNAFRSVTGVIKGIGGSIMSGFNSVLGGFGRMKDFIFSSFAQLGSFLRLSFETITNPIEGLKKAMGGMMNLLFGGSMIKKLLMGALVGGAAAFGLKKLYDSNPAFKKFVDDMGAKVKNLLIGKDGKTGIIFGDDGKSGIWGTLKGWVKKAGSYLWTVLFGDGAKEGEEKNGGLWQDFKNIMSGFGSWFMKAMFGPEAKEGETPKGGWWQNDIWPVIKGLGKSIAELFVGPDGKSGWWHEYIVPALKTAWGTVQPILKTFFYGEDGKTGLVGNAKNWFLGKPNEWSEDNKPFWERVWGWVGGWKGLTALMGAGAGALALSNPVGGAVASKAVGGAMNLGGKALKTSAGQGIVLMGAGGAMLLGTDNMKNIAKGYMDGGFSGGLSAFGSVLTGTDSKLTGQGFAGALTAGAGVARTLGLGPMGMLAGALVGGVGYFAGKMGIAIGEFFTGQDEVSKSLRSMEDSQANLKKSQENAGAHLTHLIDNVGSEEGMEGLAEALKKHTIEGKGGTKDFTASTVGASDSLSGKEFMTDVTKALSSQSDVTARENMLDDFIQVFKMDTMSSQAELEQVKAELAGKRAGGILSKESENQYNARIKQLEKEIKLSNQWASDLEGSRATVLSESFLKAGQEETKRVEASNQIRDKYKSAWYMYQQLDKKIFKEMMMTTAGADLNKMMLDKTSTFNLSVFHPMWTEFENTYKTKLAMKKDEELATEATYISLPMPQGVMQSDFERSISMLRKDKRFKKYKDVGYRGRYLVVRDTEKGIDRSPEQLNNLMFFYEMAMNEIESNRVISAFVSEQEALAKASQENKTATEVQSSAEAYAQTGPTQEEVQQASKELKGMNKPSTSTTTPVVSDKPKATTTSTLPEGFKQAMTELKQLNRDVNKAWDDAEDLYEQRGGGETEGDGGESVLDRPDIWQAALLETQHSMKQTNLKALKSKIIKEYGKPKTSSSQSYISATRNVNRMVSQLSQELDQRFPRLRDGGIVEIHNNEAVVSDLESARGDEWVASFADATMDKLSTLKPDETTTLSKAIGVSPDDPMLTTIKNLFAEQRAFIKECLYNNSGPSAELLEVNQQIAEALMEMNEKSTGDSMVLDSLINGLAEERKDASFAPPMEFRQGDIRA